MPENEKTNSDESVKANKDNKDSQRGLWIIIGVGVVVLLVVVTVGAFFVDSQRIRFITEFSLTVALATLVGVQAYIYKRQWEAMDRQSSAIEGQLNAMLEQGEQFKETRELSVAQIRTLSQQADAAHIQANMMTQSLQETRKIIEQNERSIRATEKNVEIAEKTSIYAQRAYVVAKIRNISYNDNALGFRLRIENTGNTPANDVAVAYSFDLREKSPHGKAPDSDVMVYDIGFTETERLGLIAPNGSYHVINTPEIPMPSGEEFERYKLDQLRFYCWGRIAYEDIFNEKRHTEFCFFQSYDHAQGYPCEHGNSAL